MSARRGRGFTLVELMVAMALATILIGVAGYIFTSARRLYDHSLEEIAAAGELRLGFERLGRDLRDAPPPRLAGWEPKLQAVDGPEGPDDVLTIVTLERRPDPAPCRVVVRLGARDADGLAPLTRQVTERWSAGANALAGVSEPGEVLLPRVRTFEVRHAWVLNGAGDAGRLQRGDVPELGPAPSTGARFVLRGSGTASAGVLDLTSTPWHPTLPIPRRLAHTVYVTSPAAAARAYPLLEVESTTRLRVAGLPDGTVDFWVPITPTALQVSVRHEGRNGPRSFTSVLELHP